jgi:hypothetical protein
VSGGVPTASSDFHPWQASTTRRRTPSRPPCTLRKPLLRVVGSPVSPLAPPLAHLAACLRPPTARGRERVRQVWMVNGVSCRPGQSSSFRSNSSSSRQIPASPIWMFLFLSAFGLAVDLRNWSHARDRHGQLPNPVCGPPVLSSILLHPLKHHGFIACHDPMSPNAARLLERSSRARISRSSVVRAARQLLLFPLGRAQSAQRHVFCLSPRRAEPPCFIPSCRRPGVWNIGPKRAGLRLRISFMSFNHLVIPAPCIPAAPPGRRRMHPPSRGEN